MSCMSHLEVTHAFQELLHRYDRSRRLLKNVQPFLTPKWWNLRLQDLMLFPKGSALNHLDNQCRSGVRIASNLTGSSTVWMCNPDFLRFFSRFISVWFGMFVMCSFKFGLKFKVFNVANQKLNWTLKLPSLFRLQEHSTVHCVNPCKKPTFWVDGVDHPNAWAAFSWALEATPPCCSFQKHGSAILFGDLGTINFQKTKHGSWNKMKKVQASSWGYILGTCRADCFQSILLLTKATKAERLL